MFTNNWELKKINVALYTIIAFLGFYLLYIGKFIFIPLVISFFLLVLFTWMYRFFYKYVKKRYISIVLSFFVFILFFFSVWYIVSTQAWSFMENTWKFTQGFESIILYLKTNLDAKVGINLDNYLNLDYFKSLIAKIDFSSLWKSFLGTITSIFSFVATTFIFLMFIFIERHEFKQKFSYMLDNKWTTKLNNIYKKIYHDLNTYFISKFFLALFNGIVAIIIMSLFWLDFALTFWLLVFIFDFVPAVWAIIALGLPFLYSLVTFGSIPMSLFMLLCLNIPQFVTGNFVEPKIMWDRLNLSWFILIIALLFWWAFWGIIGAFLATPIMATINIILSRFESTKAIAIFFSKNGRL